MFLRQGKVIEDEEEEEEDEKKPVVIQKKQKGMIDAGKEAAIEAEVRAARERAIIPLETRMKQFREMLQEKEVLTLEMTATSEQISVTISGKKPNLFRFACRFSII